MNGIGKALALFGRVVTGKCEGGRALTNAAQQLCAFVLLIVIPTALWKLAPLAWDEYQGFKSSIISIQRTLELRDATDAALDQQRDRDIADLKGTVLDHEKRLSRIEGRVR